MGIMHVATGKKGRGIQWNEWILVPRAILMCSSEGAGQKVDPQDSEGGMCSYASSTACKGTCAVLIKLLFLIELAQEMGWK